LLDRAGGPDDLTHVAGDARHPLSGGSTSVDLPGGMWWRCRWCYAAGYFMMKAGLSKLTARRAICAEAQVLLIGHSGLF